MIIAKLAMQLQRFAKNVRPPLGLLEMWKNKNRVWPWGVKSPARHLVRESGETREVEK